jgi:hypothetical protein
MKRLIPLLFLGSACIGTTGSEVVSFHASAAGVQGANAPFVNNHGWSVTLVTAKLHVGAVYLNRSLSISGGQERECFLAGVYVAQAFDAKDHKIDVLSSTPQPFSDVGSGTADHALTGEVWLAGERVDSQDDPTVIVDVAGTAVRENESITFAGTVTISRNRREPVTDPARPGAKPLCSKRIVSGILTSITPTDGGSLVLRVDPRAWFKNVAFEELPAGFPGEPRRIPDDSEVGPGKSLYDDLRKTDAYRFEWMP